MVSVRDRNSWEKRRSLSMLMTIDICRSFGRQELAGNLRDLLDVIEAQTQQEVDEEILRTRQMIWGDVTEDDLDGEPALP